MTPQRSTPRSAEPTAFDEADQTLRRLMPWAVSLLLHMGILAGAMLLVWTTMQPEDDPQVPVDVGMVDTPDVVDVPDTVPLEKVDPVETPTRAHVPMDDQPSPAPPITPVNINTVGVNHTQQVPRPNVNPTRNGTDGDGTGLGDGPIIPGITQNKTVFVIDASGSLIDTLPFVLGELRSLLEKMQDARAATKKPYEFAIIFFRNGQVIELGGPGTGLPRGLKPATPEIAQKAQAWLSVGASNIAPGGKTDPMPAIELALSYNPQAVVLLSDNITGQGIHAIDPETLIDSVMDLRGDRPIVFNTIQFLYPDPAEQYGQTGTLERLAKETEGEYRFVRAEQLDLR